MPDQVLQLPHHNATNDAPCRFLIHANPRWMRGAQKERTIRQTSDCHIHSTPTTTAQTIVQQQQQQQGGLMRKLTTASSTKKKRAVKLVWRQRDMQDSQYYNLQLDVNDVKQQIYELHQLRDVLRAQQLNQRHSRDTACIHTVVEYLRVFRHGFNAYEVDISAFLHHIMAPQVWINEVCGNVDMIIAQWKVYSACFSTIDLRCQSVVALPVQSDADRQCFVVRATARYQARLTHCAILTMFPHLERFPNIARHLIGRVLEGTSSYDFVFDSQTNRILRCDVAMDFLGSFAALLQSPEAVNIVFNGANVASDFYICGSSSEDSGCAPTIAPPQSKMDLDRILS